VVGRTTLGNRPGVVARVAFVLERTFVLRPMSGSGAKIAERGPTHT
jgi:hypothetical protein